MRLAGVPFYPAHPSNYTVGRNRAVRFITIHHTAANNTTLRHLWANPDRNGSSHFFVSDTVTEQYVELKDTAWTNGNFASNNESITIEINGNWATSHFSQATLNRLEDLFRRILQHYPNVTLNYHNDIVATACPGSLKSKGYAQATFNKAKGGSMLNLNRARILAFSILGRLTALTGSGDSDLNAHHVGRKTTEQAVDEFFNSQEGRNWRERTLPDLQRRAAQTNQLQTQVNTLNKQITDLTATNKRLLTDNNTLTVENAKLKLTNQDLSETIKLQANEIKALNKEIADLQAQLAVVSDDTDNLNKLGEVLRWFITRIGLTK
jgi:regulator of replication initiation timing